MLDYSFNSQENVKTLSQLQQSILKQYKKLTFGQKTLQFQVNALNYTNLPPYFPENLKSNQKCLKLQNCRFFQMLTYAVFEFLFNKRSPEKDQILNRIKKIICQKKFMDESPSTKGFLLKGIKMMYDFSQNTNNTPIAHCLWKNDCMMSFTQFWKFILSKICMKNIVQADNPLTIQANFFQLLANYLYLNFNIYYSKNQQFENQMYNCTTQHTNSTIKIIIYSQNEKHDCSKILQNSFATQINAGQQIFDWNYIILPDYQQTDLSREQISAIQIVDQSIIDEKQSIVRLLKCQPQKNKSRPSFIKQQKGLQTTRTKKSSGQSNIKNIQFKDENIQQIKNILNKADKVIQQIKSFCSAFVKQ